jgi:hypothetical protein
MVREITTAVVEAGALLILISILTLTAAFVVVALA